MKGIHWWSVISPHKGPVTRKLFPFDDVIMNVTTFYFTGDPLHSRALAHSRAPLFTQPCTHCSHSRAPGEQWARLCVFTLQGCVQAARLCRGSPVYFRYLGLLSIIPNLGWRFTKPIWSVHWFAPFSVAFWRRFLVTQHAHVSQVPACKNDND